MNIHEPMHEHKIAEKSLDPFCEEIKNLIVDLPEMNGTEDKPNSFAQNDSNSEEDSLSQFANSRTIIKP